MNRQRTIHHINGNIIIIYNYSLPAFVCKCAWKGVEVRELEQTKAGDPAGLHAYDCLTLVVSLYNQKSRSTYDAPVSILHKKSTLIN